MNAMIFAAGRGHRLSPITDTTPKPLLEFDGVSLLARHLHALRISGYKRVVINLGWLGDQIVSAIGGGKRFGLDVIYSNEGDQILETGGGAFRALPMLGPHPFLAVNADILTDMPAPPATLRDDDLGKLILVPRPEEKTRGDFSMLGDRVSNAEPRDLTYGGFAIYRPEFFSGCESGKFSVVPLMRAAADAGRLGGKLYTGYWSDIGTPERLITTQRSTSLPAVPAGQR